MIARQWFIIRVFAIALILPLLVHLFDFTVQAQKFNFTLGPSVGENFIKKPEESVSLTCWIIVKYGPEDYNVIKTPMIWTKIQDNVESSLAVLGLMSSPFKETGRHVINYDNQKFVVTISRLKLEDTGTYRCEVGDQSITYNVTVVDEVQTLNIYGYSGTTIPWQNLDPLSGMLNLNRDRPGMVQCVARGFWGFIVQPQLSVYIDNQNETGKFELNHSCNLTGPTKGLQLFDCIAVIGHNKFYPRLTSRTFECRAHLHTSVPDKVKSVELHIKGVPFVMKDQCPNAVYTKKNERNVLLKCLFTSTPVPNSIAWKVDSSATNVTSDSPKGRFMAENQLLGSGLVEARLVITEVLEEDFHLYVLKVINDNLQLDLRKIDLRDEVVTARVSGASIQAQSYWLVISVALAICVVILRSEI